MRTNRERGETRRGTAEILRGNANIQVENVTHVRMTSYKINIGSDAFKGVPVFSRAGLALKLNGMFQARRFVGATIIFFLSTV